MRQKRHVRTLIVLLVIGALLPIRVGAQSSSNSYRVEEAYFGSGGEVDLNSGSYNVQAGLGSLGVGLSSSTNYDVEAGFYTPNAPYLEMFVNSTVVDLGTLSSSSTGTGVGVFWIRTYLSSSYFVKTMSQSLTSEGGAVLSPKLTTGASSPGTEEFGINLVANTSPATFGADPVNVPDDSYADGQAFGDGPGGERDYDDPNEYAYGVGDTIARSQATIGRQAVGRTDYTISYIANISNITAGGTYRMEHDLVAVVTY